MKKSILITSAQTSITSIGLVGGSDHKTILQPIEEKNECCIFISREIFEKKPHYFFLNEEDDYTQLLEAINNITDNRPIVIVFSSEMIDDIELLVNYLSIELDSYDVETANPTIGQRIVIVTISTEQMLSKMIDVNDPLSVEN
ncbi:MAG: hypothetical protein WCO65_03160 [bacterium]